MPAALTEQLTLKGQSQNGDKYFEKRLSRAGKFYYFCSHLPNPCVKKIHYSLGSLTQP
jgi:hypothetical protein